MHTLGVEAAGTLEYLPAVQLVHALEPVVSRLYAPAAHWVHAADVAEPTAVEYTPAGQPVHVAAAGCELYRPAAHEVHAAEDAAPGAVAYMPAAQAVQLTAPASAVYEPAAQAVQPAAPVVRSAYEPAAHSAHMAEEQAAAAALKVPTPQAVHTNDEEASGTSLYAPAAHGTHVPVTELYVPTPHEVQ